MFDLPCEQGNLCGNLGENLVTAKESQNTSRRHETEQ
jgi:hypothetical protein